MQATTALALLKARSNEAIAVVDTTLSVLPSLEIDGTNRTYVALALLTASMDNANVVAYLLASKPERAWVSALALFRSQFDFFLRGAYFAKSASENELARFQKKGKMPSRASASGKKRDIYVSEVAESVSKDYGWDKQLSATLKGHWTPLSGLVHGGKELLAIYTQNDEIGNLSIDYAELVPVLDNVVVLTQLGMAVAMDLSSLDKKAISDVVEPAYNQSLKFFAGAGPA